MQELGDGLTVTLVPREMDVLYVPLESEGGARASLQNEAYTITEYDLPWVHKESKRNWLKEFLPDDLNHKARIMAYSHQSHWESYALTKKFDAFARDLLRSLEDKQSSDEACTISDILLSNIGAIGMSKADHFHRA